MNPRHGVRSGAASRASRPHRILLHPVVRVHPLTGERDLFTGGFAHRIVGLSTGESRDILRLLQAYVTRPENILRVSWEPGQLVLSDNRITQHYARTSGGGRIRYHYFCAYWSRHYWLIADLIIGYPRHRPLAVRIPSA